MKFIKYLLMAAMLSLALSMTLTACDIIVLFEETEPLTEAPTEEPTEQPTEEATEEVTDEPATELPHEHIFGEWTEEKAATCTEKGSKIRTCACGETERCEIDALGHDYVDRVCTRCGERCRSEGLEFVSYGDGTCYVAGIGTCMDSDIMIPEVSPAGDLVTCIGYEAFQYCFHLTSVLVPNSVTSIEEWAFSGCMELANIDLGNGLMKIGNGAFSVCQSLTSIVIPDSVISIGYLAFDGCDLLIQKEDGVSYVDRWVIDCEDGATNVTLREDTVGIAYEAFYLQTQLRQVEVFDNLKIIDERGFAECWNLKTIRIPDSLVFIGDFAFDDCRSITSLNIPDGVTKIGKSTFSNCSDLTSITLGKNVTSIDDSAFLWCNKLSDIKIPDSVTSIGENAFTYCQKIRTIEISANVTNIGKKAFVGCSSLVGISVSDHNPKYHDDGNCLIETATKTLIVGSNASVIPSDGSVISIGDAAFFGCSNLTDIVIPNHVTTIGDEAFSGCEKLTSIIIPDSVTCLGFAAFDECRGLRSVVFPSGLTTIREITFCLCIDLTNITFTGTKAEWFAIEKEVGWSDGTGDYVVHCTDGDIPKSES